MINETRKLVKLLTKKKLTIAFAESVTCGLAAHQLSTVKGTSEVLKGAIICYDETVKTSLLKVKHSLIKKFSAESQEVTDALATNLGSLIKADVHAAFTGLSSDGASEHEGKPVGTIFFSIRYKNKMYRTKKLFRGSPLKIKKKACVNMYKRIIQIIS